MKILYHYMHPMFSSWLVKCKFNLNENFMFTHCRCVKNFKFSSQIVIYIIFFMLRLFTRGSNTNWNQGQQFLILANLADWQPWAEANSITNFWAFSPFISKHFEFFKIIKYQIRFLTAQIFLGKHFLVKAHVSNIKYLTFI